MEKPMGLNLPTPRTTFYILSSSFVIIVGLLCGGGAMWGWNNILNHSHPPPPTATMTPATATPEPTATPTKVPTAEPTIDIEATKEAEYYRGLYDACVHQIKEGGRVEDVVKFCNTSVGNIKKSGWYGKESPGYNLNLEPKATSVPLPLQGG